MVHSFKEVESANSNLTIQFYEDDKTRRIIFTKDSDAIYLYVYIRQGDANLNIKECLISLREFGYKFIVNKNNKSIFRPVKR